MPVASMTGFGSVRGALPDGTEFSLSIKSVNHRTLDLHLRLPPRWDAVEMEIRQMLKARLRRGHVEVMLVVEGRTGATQRLDVEAVSAYVRSFRDLQARLGLCGEPDLNALLRLPGVVVSETTGVSAVPDPGRSAAAVMAGVTAALYRLIAMRTAEGEALGVVIEAAMARVLALSAEIASLRAGVQEAHVERLRERLAALLGSSNMDPARLLAEAALLADRSDVEEEIVRLRTHAASVSALLREGGEVGKRLDFLLQELVREANTLLSKTGSASGKDHLQITELGLAIKAEIERAREQVQNLE